MTYLPMRAAHRGWNPPEKERYVADSNAGMAEPSKPSIPEGIIGFGIFPAVLCCMSSPLCAPSLSMEG